MRLEAGSGVAEGSGTGLNQVLELLLAETLDKAGALNRPQLGADADREEVVDYRLVDIGVGPDSPDGLSRQDRRPRKRWRNYGFLLSPVGSVMNRLPDPA